MSSHHHKDCDSELGEAHDAHDFLGHDHVAFEGTAHMCSFLSRGQHSPVSMITGLFVPEDIDAAMSIMGVDVTALTPRNCCLGPDCKVFLMKITEVRSKKTIKIQAISSGGDGLVLQGKHVDFSAEETFVGPKALLFMKTIVPGALEIVDPNHSEDVIAWSGPLKLAGFKFSTMSSDVLDLTR